jgi:multidrug/hemolysin transport system permease protein
MKLVLVLLHRNLRVFWRDRLTVLLTLTAPLVLLLLFVVFFRRMTAEAIMQDFTSDVSAMAYAISDAWMVASAVTLTTFSCTLGLLAGFVDDRASGRFSDYLVSPLQRWQLTLSYILSAFLVSSVLSSLLMLASPLWALIQGQAIMSGLDVLQAVGAVMLNCLFFATVNTVAVTFLSSQGGWNGYALIMGIAVGFLNLSYTPPSALSATISDVVSALPFAQGGALVRLPLMSAPIDNLVGVIEDPAVHDEARETIQWALGTRLEINGEVISVGLMVMILLGLAVVGAVVGAWRMRRVIR